MADAQKYAEWIVANQDKKGTPEFDTVAAAYKAARGGPQPEQAPQAPPKPLGPVQELTGPEKFAQKLGFLEKLPDARNNPVTQGVSELGIGLTQAAANSNPVRGSFPEFTQSVNDAVRKNEEGYQASRGKDAGSFDAARLGSSILNPLALGAAGKLFTAMPSAGARIAIPSIYGAGQGGSAPVTDAKTEGDYDKQAGKNAIVAAILSSIIPGGWEAAKAGGRTIRNVTQGAFNPEGASGRLMNEASGSRAPAVRESLLQAEAGQTAQQAVVPSGSTEAAALIEIAKKRKPSDFRDIAIAQQEARLGEIRKVGKDEAALEAAINERSTKAAKNYGEIKDNKIDPRSEKQVWNEKVKGAEQRTQDTANADFYPVPGQPKLPGKYSEAFGKNEAHEEAFKNAYQLLKDTVGVEDSSLKTLLNRPSIQKAVRTAMESAQERGVYFPSKPGEKFSVENLQRMKVALDDALSGNPATALDKGVAADVKGTRGAFIDWLGSRSTDWKKARLNFAEDSKPINQMQVGQFLEGKLRAPLEIAERPGVFATAVKDAPGTIKKAASGNTFDKLSDVLDEPSQKIVDAIMKGLQTDAYAKEMARAGMDKAGRLVGDMSHVQGTGLLNRYITLGTSALRKVASGATDKTMDSLAELSKDPKRLAEVMAAATPGERKAIVDALMQGQARAIGVGQGEQ